MLLCKVAVRGVLSYALVAVMMGAVPVQAATTLPTQSWNGWKWARTGNLAIQLGQNVSANWKPFLADAAATWSTNPVIDYVLAPGKTNGAVCGASFGTLQVCSGNYGETGWLGYTKVWTSGGKIVQATIQFNDFYFSKKKYNTDAFREYIACQELGNALGLDDADRGKSNINLGSCMDYSNDPSGLLGTNGVLANTTASVSDLINLAAIYALPDATQLPQTKPTVRTNAFTASVPEPSSWGMMIAGFGMVGAAFRRRRRISVAFA
jgi:hypothetical protein